MAKTRNLLPLAGIALLTLVVLLVGGTPLGTGKAEAAIGFRNAAQAGAPGPGTIAFRNAAQAGAGSGVLTLSINRPTGTLANDVMVASIGISANTPTITAPAGWNIVPFLQINNAGPTANALAVYWKLAGDPVSDPGPYTWTFSASSGAAGGIVSFSGVDTVSTVQIDSGQTTASSLTHATPSIFPTSANVMLVASFTFASSATWGAVGGMTQAFTQTSQAAGANGQSTAVYWVEQTLTGTWGPYSATASGVDADAGNTHILALRPADKTSLTINKPTGTVQNDVMIASIGFRASVADMTTVVVTPPDASWNLQRRMDNNNPLLDGTALNSLAVYWKLAGASEPASYTWTFSASGRFAGGILSFSGVDTTGNPINIDNGQVTPLALTHATPSVTTTVANTMLVTSHTYASAATWTPPTFPGSPISMNEAVDVAGGVQSLEVNWVIQAAAGPTGVYTATAANDADGGNTHILALREVPPAPDLQQIHYRWRNDDGGEGAGLNTGTGADGSVTIATSQNINTAILGSNRTGNPDGVVTTVTANPTGTSITVTSSTGFAAGDEILLINLRGAFGDTADVGNYEFLRVDSVPNGTTINVSTAIQKSYDGTTFASQRVVVQRVPQWTTVTINSGGTLTANAWGGTSGGIIMFRATGTVTVNTGGTISANAIGYAGGGSSTTGGGLNGESYDGVGSAGVSAGGDDTTPAATGGGNIGTRGGGASSDSGLATSNTAGTRGGGGGGGNSGGAAADGSGGGAGGGYGFGGGGGGGGTSIVSTLGGAGGAAGSTSVNGGGGGGTSPDNAAGGAGGAAGSVGGTAEGGAVGSGTLSAKGGAGNNTTCTGCSGSGGGGGGSYGVAALTTIFFGSGGGGGGGHDTATATAGATGGAGGGIIFIVAGTITLPGTGTITANAANGGAASLARAGNSGAGAGGSIYLSATSTTLGTTLVTATGGTGGAATIPAGGGGAGGHGRIRIEATSITGTTNPAASTAGTPVGTSATWAAAEDTLLNLAKSTLKRLRFEVSNEGTGAASGTTYRLEVSGPDPASCSAAAFSVVPTAATGHWQIVDSANLTGGAATTNVTPGLTDANPTFVPGRVMDTGNQTTGISLSTTEFTEIEFALQATTNATDGALYCFRLTNAGATTNFTYVQYGQARLLGLDHFLVEAFGGGSIGTQTAGTPFSIRITAQDINNSTWTAFTGTVNITSTGTLSAGGGTTAAFVNGVLASHSVTISNTGSFTITATRTSGGTQTGTSNAFTVNPGALNNFLVEAAGGGSIGTQTAGTPFNIKITARDAYNNTVTGFTGAGNTVNITSTGTLSAGGGTTAAFVNGVLASHSVTISNTGSFTITATRTSGGAQSGTSNAFTVNPNCGAVADAAYVAANAQNGQATVYWSSANPVLILRKSATSITDAPTNGVSYTASNTIGASTVIFDGASSIAGVTCTGTSCTNTGLSASTTYYYKVFANSGTCYSPGTEVNALMANASAYPPWSYMMANGSTMRAGIAGTGSLNSSGNFGRIISLNTANGTQYWAPVATNAAVQGWLTWLPVGFQYRQNITVTAGAAAVPTDYSVSVTFNHASMVAAGKSRADGGDVRVRYWNGASWVHLDRVLDEGSAWNTATTRIWFKTQAAISAAGTDANYYLYYGYPDAGSPPANPNNVYLFYDDFNWSDAPSNHGWTVQIATWSAAGGVMTSSGSAASSGVMSHSAATTDAVIEARAQGRADVCADCRHIGVGLRLSAAGAGYIAFGYDQGSISLTLNNFSAWGTDVGYLNIFPQTLTADTWYRIKFQAISTTLTAKAWQDGTAEPGWQASATDALYASGTQIALYGGWTSPKHSEFDWVKVRKAVNPEPSTALAVEVALSGESVIGADQGTGAPDTGRVYSVDRTFGIPDWQVTLTGADGIQTAVAAQLRRWSDAAFQAAYGDDVLFVATRNASLTNNKLFALRASDGSVLWSFNGTIGSYNVDYIVGMPWVDYARNRVYVVSRAGAGAQSSLWVINSLTGALVTSFALGHITASPTMSYDGATLYVGNEAGTLYAINLNTLAQKWSLAIGGALKGSIWEDWTTAGRLYFATTSTDQVRCVLDQITSGSIQWTTAVTAPSTPLPMDTLLYVGSSDGKVHQLRLSDGFDDPAKRYTVGSGTYQVGDVSTETLTEIFVPTTEGKLYKLPLSGLP